MRLRSFHSQTVDTQGHAKRTTEQPEGTITLPKVDVAETEEICQVLDRNETLPGGHMPCMLICRPAMGTATTMLSPKQAYRLDAKLATPTAVGRAAFSSGGDLSAGNAQLARSRSGSPERETPDAPPGPSRLHTTNQI
jgi:hypothetical protein